MADGLLEGIRVIDLAGEPAAMAGRILADLGADVVLVEPPGGHPLRALPSRFAAWAAGKRTVSVAGPDDPELDELLRHRRHRDRHARLPGRPRRRPRAGARHRVGRRHAVRRRRPACRLARIRPRRHGGEREHVLHRRSRPRAGALHRAVGLRATSVRGRVRRAHRARDRPAPARRRVDAGGRVRREHGGAAQFRQTRLRGQRRGANIGRTREIWPHADGWVSFGLRGGKARVPSLTTLTRLVTEDGLDAARSPTATGPTSRTTPRPTTTSPRSRPTSPRTSPGTRCRSSTTSRARPT